MRVVGLAAPARAFAFDRFFLFFSISIAILLTAVAPASGTSVIPTTDGALYATADVVVHGVVQSSSVREALDGSPETVTVIEPIEVLKGGVPGNLVLRQAGGTLPNGKFFRLWGRPEYVPGQEVVVFAISRPDGDFQTSEMLLGKFEVWKDEKQRTFAVSDLSQGDFEGVHIVTRQPRSNRRSGSTSTELNSLDGPRDLAKFLAFLRLGAKPADVRGDVTLSEISPVLHFVDRDVTPSWAPISGLWRYSNGANAGWTLVGTANITGGGAAEAQRALATWTNEPNSTINHYIGGTNNVHLNALTSPCGWSTALPSSLGVVGCGGPRGGGSHVWRNETYGTITGGEVWLRAYSTFNQLSSVVTESIILHEIGHALGLGHSDQAASAHDTCRGDESAAIMRSSVQSRTTLGTDDVDAVRWLYGDGGKSCSAPPPPPPPSGTITPAANPLDVCDGTGLGVTTISWDYPGVSVVEIRVNSPSGALFARGGSRGTAVTGKWVRNGTIFYARNASSGATLGSVTMAVRCNGLYVRVNPTPVRVCDGTGLGTARIEWNFPGVAAVEIRVGSPTGALFARGAGTGAANTGKWVKNGTTFYAVNRNTGASLGAVTALLTSSGC